MFCGSGWHIAHMCTHCIYYIFNYIGCKSVCVCKYCLFAVFDLLFSGWTPILQRDTPSGLWRLVGSSSCCPCTEWTRLKSKDTSAHAQRRRRSGTWNFKFMQSPQRMNPKHNLVIRYFSTCKCQPKYIESVYITDSHQHYSWSVQISDHERTSEVEFSANRHSSEWTFEMLLSFFP